LTKSGAVYQQSVHLSTLDPW